MPERPSVKSLRQLPPQLRSARVEVCPHPFSARSILTPWLIRGAFSAQGLLPGKR